MFSAEGMEYKCSPLVCLEDLMVEYSAEPDVEKQEDETKTVDSNKQDM